MTDPVLDIRGLDVRFDTPDGEVHAVKGADFELRAGECVGVVGESGSGKTQLFLAMLGLLASNGRVSGAARFRGTELLGLRQRDLNVFRGDRITMVFQDPLTSLTPHMRIGDQLAEVLVRHRHMTREEADALGLELLKRARIQDAERRLKQYPHELSGGMRQRVMIAMALLCKPDVLIADEPTTALDVTVQAQILDLLKELRATVNTAIVLITHDMGIVAGLCDRVVVMKEGEIVERGTIDEIFYAPKHDYTQMLLTSMPRLDRPTIDGVAASHVDPATEILAVEDVRVHFPIKLGGLFGETKPLKAVDGVSFKLVKGETLGIVGESGCGKSTLARAVLQLVRATSGRVVFKGTALGLLKHEDVQSLRRGFQVVFQDPLASLDPRMTIGESIAEPLRHFEPGLTPDEVRAQVKAMIEKVGLDPRWINRYPHELSGGQNQRVGIARAMIARPDLLVCDEAVSALDVSIRGQILKLLMSLQAEFGMSMLFISHDLSVVRQIAHRVMVLFLGRIVELADTDRLYADPRHPYTRALIAAVPIPDPKIERAKTFTPLMAELPSPMDPDAPLTFLGSKRGSAGGETYVPKLIEVAPGHLVAEHDPVAP